MADKESLNLDSQLAETDRDWEDLTPAIHDKEVAVPAAGTADSLLRARRAESGLETPAPVGAHRVETKTPNHQEPLGSESGSATLSSASAEDTATGETVATEEETKTSDTESESGETAGTVATSAPAAEVLPSSIAQTQAEAEERASAREIAVADRPRLLSIRKAIIALSVPLLTLALAVRTVATSGFLWLEYHRPGFPADSYGLNSDERMTLGSYGLNYILNFAPASYLGNLRNEEGIKWFLPTEVEHMSDVKLVMLTGLTFAFIVGIAALIASRTLKERAAGAIRSSLFIGSWITLALLAGLGVSAVLGWQSFFENFHRIFFPQGNWTFRESDTLIRLFPPQFWLDAGITVAILSVALTVLVMILTWPTKFRRAREQKVAADRLELRRKLSS